MPVGSYRILPSDPHWPRMFADERLRIAEAMHLAVERIEHIGSTAVAGLGAKPIIDVMAGIDIPPTSPRGGPLLDRVPPGMSSAVPRLRRELYTAVKLNHVATIFT